MFGNDKPIHELFFFLLQATNSSKVLKTRDSAFLSADLQGERGAEEKEEERGPEEDGEAETEVKDEAGSGANSPCQGKAFSMKSRFCLFKSNICCSSLAYMLCRW